MKVEIAELNGMINAEHGKLALLSADQLAVVNATKLTIKKITQKKAKIKLIMLEAMRLRKLLNQEANKPKPKHQKIVASQRDYDSYDTLSSKMNYFQRKEMFSLVCAEIGGAKTEQLADLARHQAIPLFEEWATSVAAKAELVQHIVNYARKTSPPPPQLTMPTTPSINLPEVLRLHALWLRGDPAGCRAILAGANLTSADLTSADLTGANLVGANLTGADLVDADLAGANLADADLAGANLTGANLAGAILTDADLAGAILTGADLVDADLAGANLARAILTGANLARATLTGAILTGAILTGANLVDADLAGAILTRANLVGANLVRNNAEASL